jgi:hypothetical protein
MRLSAKTEQLKLAIISFHLFLDLAGAATCSRVSAV